MFRFDPYAPAIDADPFPAYRILRDEYPCFWSEDAQMWVLSRHSDILTALNEWRTYSSAKGNLMTELPNRAGATLGTTDPPRHDRLRGLIQHAFTRRGLEGLGEPMRQIAADIADELRGCEEFDFIADFNAKYTARVLFAALGLPVGDEEVVRRNAVLMVQSDPVTRAKGPEHIAAYNWMRDYAAEIIAERRARPQNDLISHFSMAEIDGDRLDEQEVLLTTTTLIMAGVESLGGFLAMFGLNLADHPEARRSAVADPAVLADAIEESLRFNTSAQRFRRCLVEDVEIHGQTMRAGDFVCLAYGSGNRDERRFPNPDVYDIARKPRGHLGFGGGVHACLGAMIARMAVKIAMEEFHKAVPDYVRAEQNLKWMPSSTFRSPLKLMLRRC
ncbi:MAG: cytochrome P450 [Alphaproteobacteria bacterium]|nr:cytochrome P450 [Alphaproteobacteria bacterium]MBU6471263.1 cytochrome P450 [Alphaproteobacteria bacterium]MDE2011371.1 cytochrome P450 [Alphaproteobacteria bacterium]MDE2072891.1 cytochrome P450 [Alphaproteobacteria bacterium]MDE2352436.1 cytochrome P450 [Alphaproteobacteria bacterium]